MLLVRAGHHVTVYERSRRGLVGRGGGVTMSRTLLDRMIAADLIDANFASCAYGALHMSKVTEEASEHGRCPLQKPLDMNCVHWSGLWENIRKRVPDDIYHHNVALADARHQGDGVSLTFEDGKTATADLVLFADGYNSLGRRIMFPDVALKYRGYTVWRGVVPENEVPPGPPRDIHPRFSLATLKGSFISYMIPNREGSVAPGERLFNWACYFPLPEQDLASFMVDNQGESRIGTIPAGAMRRDQDDALKAMIAAEMPRAYAEIVAGSQDNQIQQIYTSELDAYGKGRMCLMGDAGMMVPPLTGAGVFKGFTNALDLAEAIDRDVPLAVALADWSAQQTRVARSMLAMGMDMEEAFIWNTIDLATQSPEACADWFDRSIRIAEEFSYFAV